ncbi:MAG: hypothetical protein GY870_10265 [archaeon]|nr:hypothetical protein [archaeon]
MSVSEIALHLDRSKGWAGMRVGLIGEMSELVMNEILNGKFPVYSYMYTIRSFMRMNGIKKEEIDKFVCSVSGRGISIRDIEILAQGYFKGSESIRNEINNGNISFGLNFLRDAFDHSTGCSKLEQRMLIDLGLIQKYIHRVINNDSAQKLFMSNSFNVQANLLTGSILRQMDIFLKIIKGYYDKSRQEESSLSSS